MGLFLEFAVLRELEVPFWLSWCVLGYLYGLERSPMIADGKSEKNYLGHASTQNIFMFAADVVEVSPQVRLSKTTTSGEII